MPFLFMAPILSAKETAQYRLSPMRLSEYPKPNLE